MAVKGPGVTVSPANTAQYARTSNKTIERAFLVGYMSRLQPGVKHHAGILGTHVLLSMIPTDQNSKFLLPLPSMP